LGGALSTVIGYYFGRRSIQDASASVQLAEMRAAAAERHLQEQVDAPNFTEDGSQINGMFAPDEYIADEEA
jgi:hypothetical protein